MSDLKLNRLNEGDSQGILIGKINQNFKRILDFFGGPYGKKGQTGRPGPIGPDGPIGPKGARGSRGNLWSFSPAPPEIGISGDYWINSLDGNSIHVLSADNIWEYQNIKLKSSDYFTKIANVSGPSTKDCIVQSSPNPEKNNLTLNSITSSSATINPQYSRLLIETNPGLTSGNFDQSIQPLIEFTKTLPMGATGNASKSTLIQWDTTNHQYGLSIYSRSGGISLDFISGIELLSSGGVFAGESYKDSVQISSSSVNATFGGTFSWSDQDSSKKNLKLVSNNFKLDVSSDYSVLNSPLHSYYHDVNTGVTASNRFASSITNYIPASNSVDGGGNLELNVDTSVGSGLLWRGNYPFVLTQSSGSTITNYEDTIKITSLGEFKMTREANFGSISTNDSPVSHGSYGGTTYYWMGIVPSQHPAGSMTSAERIDWDGEELVVINTTSTQDIGIYLQNFVNSYYYSSGKGLRLKVMLESNGKFFKAVGIGTFYSGSFYPFSTTTSNSVRQWAAIPPPYAKSVEFFILPPPPNNVVSGNSHTVYYEAFGPSGGVSNGILYS